MPSLNSVGFDDVDLPLQDEDGGRRTWCSAQGDEIGLHYFDKVPDISASLESVDDLRKVYRSLAMAAGLAVIEIERVELQGCVAIRTLFKAPQEPVGTTYLGAITLPLQNCSYVIKIQCAEHGMTGLREAVVMAKMRAAEQIDINETDGSLSGWMQDPYDASVKAPSMRNLAEDERYDADFPEHPLSRARSFLRHVQSTVRIDPEVKSASPFIFDGSPHSVSRQATRKPWWKIW